MISIRRKRIFTGAPVLILAFLGFAVLQFRSFGGHPRQQDPPPLFTLPADNSSTSSTPSGSASTAKTTSLVYDASLISFWDSLSKALLEEAPPCALPDDPIKAPVIRFSNLKKSSKRPDLLKLPKQDIADLQNAHSRYVARMLELVLLLPFEKGTQGIVTIATRDLFPIMLVSVRMLRRTGSKMPIQIFMESKDVYEEEICDEILPKLNATCFLLSDILYTVPQRLESDMSRYQLKAFAMLFSSFDDVLLFDPDSVVVEQPDQLLNTEPFISTGFVSWPDYWASTASPKYYEISSQPIPTIETRASSESGLLLLSKSKHASTLLLSLYYNYYGPSHYYTLLSQGSVGQGDKETYVAAATSLNTSLYTISTNIDELGFIQGKDRFRGCGAAQANPTDDYNKNVLRNGSITEMGYSYIHAQTYKMSAAEIPEFFNEEINQRMWGPKEPMVKKFGGDIEKQLWAETLYTGCQLERAFKAWLGKHWVCENIGRVYRTLFD